MGVSRETPFCRVRSSANMRERVGRADRNKISGNDILPVQSRHPSCISPAITTDERMVSHESRSTTLARGAIRVDDRTEPDERAAIRRERLPVASGRRVALGADGWRGAMRNESPPSAGRARLGSASLASVLSVQRACGPRRTMCERQLCAMQTTRAELAWSERSKGGAFYGFSARWRSDDVR